MTDFTITVEPLDGTPIEAPPKKFAREIIAEVATSHGLLMADLVGKPKVHSLIEPRRAAMKRVRAELGYSYPQIGRLFNRDHTTVMYALRGKRRSSRPPRCCPHCNQPLTREARS